MPSLILRAVLFAIVIQLAAIGGAANPAMAQIPELNDLPESMLQPSRVQRGDKIVFCINARSMNAEFDRDLARLLTKTLLLEHAFVEMEPMLPASPYDFRMMMSESEIYLTLAHECDAMVGMTQMEFPEWMSGTPAYLSTRTVMVAHKDQAANLERLDTAVIAIGSRFLSIADTALQVFTLAQPESRRWRRILFADNAKLLDAFRRREFDAALVWEPALNSYLADHPGLDVVTTTTLPFSLPHTSFVVAFLRSNDFLNVSLSSAILNLDASGELKTLARKHGLAFAP